MDKRFPILISYQTRQSHPNIPSDISWDIAETFRTQAERNHSQTLERLAERGGLDVAEIRCAVTDQKTSSYFTNYNEKRFDEDVIWLSNWLKEKDST